MALALVEDGRPAAGDGGALVDPFDGLADLQARCLRVLHDRSFADDATRLWRGARTAALYGLEPDSHTAQLITQGARWVEEISGERLWAELAYTARRGGAGARGVALATLRLLDAWGVLRVIHPAFCLTDAAASALDRREAMPPERLAAVLLAPLAERDAILERLHAPGYARTVVDETARLLAAAGATSPDALAPLEGTCEEARTAARWLDPKQQRALQSALHRWERTKPWLTAEQLIAEGLPKGPEVGAALRGLRRGRYLGTLSTLAEARRHVRLVLAGEANWDSK
jgi:tRNA nucleotidyltransferase (CCA-adding enzyme)